MDLGLQQSMSGETVPTWDWAGQELSGLLPCLLQGLLLLPLSPLVPSNHTEYDRWRKKQDCWGPLTTLEST